MLEYDVLIIGAGAAGLFCGAQTGQRGKRVLVIDHAKKPAEKVRISGGGRCNFTNIHTAPENFISENSHFAKSALARYTPWDFTSLLAEYGITWHEKTLGQLFCDGRSGAVIQMLLDELTKGGGDLWLETTCGNITYTNNSYLTETDKGPVKAKALVIATGGLSIPKMGATGFAYDVARQFGHDIIETRPALVPFTFSGELHDQFAALSGVACDVTVEANGAAFTEAMLFTHRGLSGPAMLQASSYWRPGDAISIDLMPGTDATAYLTDYKTKHPAHGLEKALSPPLPERVARYAADHIADANTALNDYNRARLQANGAALKSWTLKPVGTEGYRTAEVTAGGVNTNGLSSQTMESKHAAGLYFIGECVDVTGWLGGYNFQWAWASAHAAAEAIAAT